MLAIDEIAQLRRWFERRGLAIIRNSTLSRLMANETQLNRHESFLPFLKRIRPEHLASAIDYFPNSRSEFFQDIFGALLKDECSNGFFVEFGATDGVTGSNTWLFERHLGWSGILAEPAKVWHLQLAANRRCQIIHDCVWSRTGETIRFFEAKDGGFSTIKNLVESDRHRAQRRVGSDYVVQTITLGDMLENAAAPNVIDIMTIDTEGSEFEILKAFEFKKWQINVLCVEHNFRDDRKEINALLTENGYIRVLPSLSGVDDWFIAGALEEKMQSVFTSPKD